MGSIVFADSSVSHAQFNQRVARAAAGLASLGVASGGGVAIMMRNEPTFIEASMAIGFLGAYSVAINWHSVESEVKFVLEDSGADVLIVHTDLLKSIRNAIPARVRILEVETPQEILRQYDIPDESAVSSDGAESWRQWRDRFTSLANPSSMPPQTIFYTSGTTGRPKGVKRILQSTQAGKIFTTVLQRSYGFTGEHGEPSECSTVVTGPMYHGMPNAHSVTSVRMGLSVTIMARFDPERLLQIIQEQRVTHLSMVPIMFNRLLKLPQTTRDRYDISSLRFVSHAAAPISPVVKREMISWWGKIIYEYYGATEVLNCTFCNSEEWLAHPGTVGKAVADAEVRILDKEGRCLPAGEVGEIAARTFDAPPMTYLNNEEARRKIELAPGLMSAGDVGYLDQDGFLFLCDRNNDMIISGGANIYPAQIEAALQTMPGVADCAVFGIPDQEFGESVHAVVQPVPGASLDAQKVRNFLRLHVSSHMVPRTVDFSDNLPREDSGKLFKRKLREPFWAGAGRRI